MKERIEELIRAGYPAIALVTSEEDRAKAELASVAQALGYQLWTWSLSTGLTTIDGVKLCDEGKPGGAVQFLADLVPEDMGQATEEELEKCGNKLIVFLDYHMFLAQPNPMLVRALKDELARAKEIGRTLVFLGCKSAIPAEIEKDVAIVDFDLPDKGALKAVMEGLCSTNGVEVPENTDDILESMLGMTTTEAECALSLSLVTKKKLDPATIWHEKAQIVKKSGVLEFVETGITFDNVGGYDEARAYYEMRRRAFSDEAKAYGLPPPKGVLVVGVQGGGKSLMGHALSNLMSRPLIKCDFGNLRGGIQGESEQKMRTMIQTAEAVAPCILFMDEIEKGLAGYASDHMTTGGTGGRQLQMLLPWMEKANGVYIYATSNDITKLPPELMRKGRFDEIFFVDLPSCDERKDIWDIQIAKYNRDPHVYLTAKLAVQTEGFTGAEIEQAFIDALYSAFALDREPSMQDVEQAIKSVFPLSKLMGKEIQGLRDWAKGRTRSASTQSQAKASTGQGKRRIKA